MGDTGELARIRGGIDYIDAMGLPATTRTTRIAVLERKFVINQGAQSTAALVAEITGCPPGPDMERNLARRIAGCNLVACSALFHSGPEISAGLVIAPHANDIDAIIKARTQGTGWSWPGKEVEPQALANLVMVHEMAHLLNPGLASSQDPMVRRRDEAWADSMAACKLVGMGAGATVAAWADFRDAMAAHDRIRGQVRGACYDIGDVSRRALDMQPIVPGFAALLGATGLIAMQCAPDSLDFHGLLAAIRDNKEAMGINCMRVLDAANAEIRPELVAAKGLDASEVARQVIRQSAGGHWICMPASGHEGSAIAMAGWQAAMDTMDAQAQATRLPAL